MAEKTIVSAGKRGDKVRSDCYIEIEFKKSGGLKIELTSKVNSMYGNSIEDLIKAMCKYFGIKHCNILIEDKGALPFTIAARFELAVKKTFPDLAFEFLPNLNQNNLYKTTKDRLRRSRLYLPGNEPKFFPNAGLHKPDGIILDLEDSVAYSEKKAAQLIVRNALRAVDFYGAERMVRINQLPNGIDDLKYIVPHNVHVVLVPKTEHKEQITEVENEIKTLCKKHTVNSTIYLMPIIESALGVENVYDIVTSSKNICGVAVGLEDYTADIGVKRTDTGEESRFARYAIINSAKAAKVQAIDTVFSDVQDMDGLKQSVLEAKSIGFEGKGCIHPRQIKVVHDAFNPTDAEIENAKKIVLAFEEAESKGIGVVSLGSKMIDAPVVKRARRIVKLAEENKLLKKNWKEELLDK